MEKRVISTQVQEEDLKIEKSLRPQLLNDYIGQEKAKKNLKIYIEASLEEKLLGKLPEKEKKPKKAEKATTDEQTDVTEENEGRG